LPTLLPTQRFATHLLIATPQRNGDMKFLERKEKNNYLLEMIEKDRCISLKQVADKFGCSKRTVKRMLSELKDEGHNIKYCNAIKRFLKEN